MLTENQKQCKHEDWYADIRNIPTSCKSCAANKREVETYQQGLDDRADEAIKLCDDEIIYEKYVKEQQTEPFKAMVQFGIARLEEIKSALLKLKTETKTE